MKPYLFITSELSRSVVALATAMQKDNINVAIASPATDSEISKLRIKHIKIKKSGLFGKTKLHTGTEFNDFIRTDAPDVYVLDLPSINLATKQKIDIVGHVPMPGIDLSVYSPASVAPLLQNRILDELNIAPHQRLITVISPLGFNLDILIGALDLLQNKDVAIALYGDAKHLSKQKLVRMIEKSGHHITYIGADKDIASTLRSSYAVLGLGNMDPVLLMAAVAMGRPTVWPNNEYNIHPNASLGNMFSSQSLAAALGEILGLSETARTKIERENIATAQNFDVQKVIKLITNS
ncbi:MAG: hypothetical protein FWC83_00880 [Alphaproteobacteria bacterium]|nr:hypothetical protein [Alphaproteobacteria bacterium]